MKKDCSIVLVVHDIRSCHNVGSLLRTSEGIGVKTVFFTGYTPYPSMPKDARLPHIHQKLTAQIHKTALGAENTQPWQHISAVHDLLASLKGEGYTLVALEQSDRSTLLHTFEAPAKVALILGREVEGLDSDILAKADVVVEIPMEGRKESFNVVQAAAMALFQFRFHNMV